MINLYFKITALRDHEFVLGEKNWLNGKGFRYGEFYGEANKMMVSGVLRNEYGERNVFIYRSFHDGDMDYDKNLVKFCKQAELSATFSVFTDGVCVKFHNIGERDGSGYAYSELIEAPILRVFLEEKHGIPIFEERKNLVEAMAKCLADLHVHYCIHGDFSENNLLWNGGLFVIDFDFSSDEAMSCYVDEDGDRTIAGENVVALKEGLRRVISRIEDGFAGRRVVGLFSEEFSNSFGSAFGDIGYFAKHAKDTLLNDDPDCLDLLDYVGEDMKLFMVSVLNLLNKDRFDAAVDLIKFFMWGLYQGVVIKRNLLELSATLPTGRPEPVRHGFDGARFNPMG